MSHKMPDGSKKWLLVKSKSPVPFEVQMEDGRLCHRHMNQLRQSFDDCGPEQALPQSPSAVTLLTPEVGGSQAQADTVEDV